MAVVLITGCSSGIGLATALAFARRGDRVHATMRDLARSAALREQATAERLDLCIEQLDVCDQPAVDATVAAVGAEEGKLDVVVCNAGVGTFAAIEEHDLIDARATFETNFWGSLHVMRAALPRMRRQGRGVIVSISSMAGRVPPGRSLGFYGASKHAIGAIADTLGSEVEPFGIRVVTIEPGMVATAITDNAPIHIPPGSPYGGLVRETAAAVGDYVRAGASPASVADAIVAAVDDPATPSHVLVGDDAKELVALFAQVGYEGWGAATGERRGALGASGPASLPSPP